MDKLKLLLTNQNKKRIAMVMVAIAALMLVNTIYQLGMHIRWQFWLSQARAAGNPTTQPASTQPAASQPTDTQPAKKDRKKKKPKKKDKPLQISADIKKRNIFTKAKPKGHGMKLTGVLGNTVLFTNRGGQTVSIEEGKTAQGVKVVGIDNYNVTIEYQGKPQTMKLFTDKGFTDRSPIVIADAPQSQPAPGKGKAGPKPPSVNKEQAVQELEMRLKSRKGKRMRGRGTVIIKNE
ncbi:MAG: hypothetical protein ACYTF1_05270 [Planctomycetota bacterium]|jgi:hypothetical protein